MRVWDHVKQEIERRGHKQAAAWLGERCGYTQQRMTNWANVRDVPPREFGNIAAALGVTVDWVASASGRAPGADERSADTSRHTMTADEQQVLDALRPLGPATKAIVMAFATLLPEDQEELGRPIIARAEQMRKYLEAALSRHGISHHASGLPDAGPSTGAKGKPQTERHKSSPSEPQHRIFGSAKPLRKGKGEES